MPDLLDALRAVVGDARVLSRPEELFVYECDGLTAHTGTPGAVVFPSETHEVQALVRACRAQGVPFVPRGAGTGLSGGALPEGGAVVIECSRMNRILEVDPVNRVEGGLMGETQDGGLAEYCKAKALLLVSCALSLRRPSRR